MIKVLTDGFKKIYKCRIDGKEFDSMKEATDHAAFLCSLQRRQGSLPWAGPKARARWYRKHGLNEPATEKTP